MSRVVYPTEKQMTALKELGLLRPEGTVVIVAPEAQEALAEANVNKRELLATVRGTASLRGSEVDLAAEVVLSEDDYLATKAREDFGCEVGT